MQHTISILFSLVLFVGFMNESIVTRGDILVARERKRWLYIF